MSTYRETIVRKNWKMLIMCTKHTSHTFDALCRDWGYICRCVRCMWYV